MQRFSSSAVGVTRGSCLMFSAFEDSDPMWTGEGPRSVRRSISFTERFHQPPIVHASIAMWDIEGGANQRADLSVDKVSEEGFELVFRTWGDTRVARIRAEWLAIGATRHEDDFHL